MADISVINIPNGQGDNNTYNIKDTTARNGLTDRPTSFVGTRSEWNALPVATQVKYSLVDLIGEGVYKNNGTELVKIADVGGSVPTTEIIDLVYPIGSIYMSVNSTNPGLLFGGTWVAWGSGSVPVGVNAEDTDFDTVEKTGGAKSHNYIPAGTNTNGSVSGTKLTSAQCGVPAHAHGLNSHKHSVGAHSHGLNSHTHSISHNHYTFSDMSSSAAINKNNPNNSIAACGRNGATTLDDYYYWVAKGSTGQADIGLTSDSRTANSGAASGSTANSSAFDSGAATGNTANNTAAAASEAHSHGFTQPTFTGTQASMSHMQPYITCYMWKRTA